MNRIERHGLWRVLILALLVLFVGCRAGKSDSEPAAAAIPSEAKGDDQDERSAKESARAPTAVGDIPEFEQPGRKGEGRAKLMPAPPTRAGGIGLGGNGVSGGGRFPADKGYGGPGTRPRPTTPAEEPLDPNGRFATTYRPGGGHLAAFEAAVARGVIPTAEREIVADIGARYWSTMDPPDRKALAMRTDMERTALPPGGGPVHVRIALRSTTKAPAGRPHLSVHLVLDVSGSMRGEPMDQAKLAAQALVDKLAATDDFSLITFSSEAEVKVRDITVGPGKASIKKSIAAIEPGGGTNISEGLRLAYEQSKTRTIPRDAIRVVLLLSDGRANAGITSQGRLSRLALEAFQDGIQTSTFGLGTDYDGALMSAIASDGAGGYYYLRNADQITPALSTELDKRLDPAATAVEVRIRLKKDVSLLRVYGSRRLNVEEAARVRAIEVAADKHAENRDKIKTDRQDDPEGGMRFLIPAFARDDNHAMLLKLQLPAGVGKRDIAVVELKYKDRVQRKNVTEEVRIGVDYANSDADSAKSAQPSVARTVQGFAAGETLMEASRLVAQGDRTAALAILTEREQILRTAATTLTEPGFNRDADRLARLRTHLGASDGMGEPLVLAMLLETAGRTHLH